MNIFPAIKLKTAISSLTATELISVSQNNIYSLALVGKITHSYGSEETYAIVLKKGTQNNALILIPFGQFYPPYVSFGINYSIEIIPNSTIGDSENNHVGQAAGLIAINEEGHFLIVDTQSQSRPKAFLNLETGIIEFRLSAEFVLFSKWKLYLNPPEQRTNFEMPIYEFCGDNHNE